MWQIPSTSDWMNKQNAHEASRAYGQELFELAGKFQTGANVLEIGCMWGISTLSMLAGNPTMHLTSVDKEFGPRNHTPEEIKLAGYEKRWTKVHMSSEDFWNKNQDHWDHVYVDGSHLYKDCMMDMNEGWKWLHSGGLLFVDDFDHKKNEDGEFGVSLACMRFLKEKHRASEIVEMWFTDRFLVMRKK